MKRIQLRRSLKPIFLDIQDVKESGNGAVIYVPKRFIGEKAYIVIEKHEVTGNSSQR